MASNDLNHIRQLTSSRCRFGCQNQDLRILRIRFHCATSDKPAVFGITGCRQANLSSELTGGKRRCETETPPHDQRTDQGDHENKKSRVHSSNQKPMGRLCPSVQITSVFQRLQELILADSLATIFGSQGSPNAVWAVARITTGICCRLVTRVNVLADEADRTVS